MESCQPAGCGSTMYNSFLHRKAPLISYFFSSGGPTRRWFPPSHGTSPQQYPPGPGLVGLPCPQEEDT